MNDDRKVIRREDGKIAKGIKLTSEEARELANKRWDGEKIEAVTDLLNEIGYENEDEAPAQLKHLARKAAVSAPGSVTALVNLIKALRLDAGLGTGIRPPKKGEKCPTCSLWNSELDVGESALVEVQKATKGQVEDDAQKSTRRISEAAKNLAMRGDILG